MSNFDPFSPNTTSFDQPTLYHNRSHVQTQYPPPSQARNPFQLLVEYDVPGKIHNQVQPQFQLGEQARYQAEQQLQLPSNTSQDRRKKNSNEGNVSQERGRSKSLNGDPLKLNGRRKYRPARSVDSAVSSRSNASGYSRGQSPLDDPTFAPAPDPPEDKSFVARGRNKRVGMPSFAMVKHSGNVMARISLKSLLLKKWRPIFWICYGDSRIVIFRSKSDFEEWATNPHLTTTDRDALVKLDVNFKDISARPGLRGYRAASVHLKDYGRRSGLMHTFKLEEWMQYGPIIIGAFASKSRTDAHTFLVVLREIMKRHKQNLSNYSSATSVASSQFDSNISQRSTKSAPQGRNRALGPGNNMRSGGSLKSDNQRSRNGQQIQQSRSHEQICRNGQQIKQSRSLFTY